MKTEYKIDMNDIEKVRMGKPYTQQMGRKQGKGAGHIVSKQSAIAYEDLKAELEKLDAMIAKHCVRKPQETNKVIPLNEEMEKVIKIFFGDSMKYLGKGYNKLAWKVTLKDYAPMVLKYGDERAVIQDVKAYNKLPKPIRKKSFAKFYWRSPRFLLQEYVEVKAKPPESEVKRLRDVARKYGLTDLGSDKKKWNLGLSRKGYYKIFDANPRED